MGGLCLTVSSERQTSGETVALREAWRSLHVACLLSLAQRVYFARWFVYGVKLEVCRLKIRGYSQSNKLSSSCCVD